MKILAIVTISLCWTSIALAGRHRKDRFSALLDPQYIDKVGDLPPPHDYKESAAMSVADLWKFLEVGLILMEQKKSALSEAMEKWTEINNGKRNPQWERAHDLANELDRMVRVQYFGSMFIFSILYPLCHLTHPLHIHK
ncbi:hypothetical protein SeMB42_g01937 [Synchytrium endobioticum]|uniref:Uncharacterized protein n=1 Tax=Synchytrium endobioticum TaxID=286115 RepID=A0A507DJP1_9FUNG|nr:hypothetical protein SeMB42_g01937 [Synchytrium endobioticum]